jgi:hypothetical protein
MYYIHKIRQAKFIPHPDQHHMSDDTKAKDRAALIDRFAGLLCGKKVLVSECADTFVIQFVAPPTGTGSSLPPPVELSAIDVRQLATSMLQLLPSNESESESSSDSGDDEEDEDDEQGSNSDSLKTQNETSSTDALTFNYHSAVTNVYLHGSVAEAISRTAASR